MQVLMPQIGMTMVEGTIESWLVNDGDKVEKDQDLVEFFTEKMTNTVKAPCEGIIKIIAKESEIIPCGEPIAEIN